MDIKLFLKIFVSILLTFIVLAGIIIGFFLGFAHYPLITCIVLFLIIIVAVSGMAYKDEIESRKSGSDTRF